jgi:hypothetical protein
MRLAGHVARMEEKRNVYRLLVGKPEEKRSLGRHWDVVDWIGLAQDRGMWRALVNLILNFQVP